MKSFFIPDSSAVQEVPTDQVGALVRDPKGELTLQPGQPLVVEAQVVNPQQGGVHDRRRDLPAVLPQAAHRLQL
jgi:hypothetical protein